MSDTPETDEQINGKPCTRFAIYAGDSLRDALVPSEFARKLERERDEAREELQDWKDGAYAAEHPCPDEVHCTCIPLLLSKIAALRKERDEAREDAKAADEHRRLAERLAEAAMFERDQLRMRVSKLQNGIFVEDTK